MGDEQAGVRISVRGEHRERTAPERADVQVRIALQGADPKRIYAKVVASSDEVIATVKERHEPHAGPVTAWSTAQVRTWVTRRSNRDGKDLGPVHHAALTLRVTFSDFADLSRWLGATVARDGVTVQSVAWRLTEERQRALATDVRAAAVRQARDKAQQYADALELGPVRPVAIADVGMLGNDAAPPAVARAHGFAAPGAAAPEVTLEPEDVEVHAAVEGQFVT